MVQCDQQGTCGVYAFDIGACGFTHVLLYNITTKSRVWKVSHVFWQNSTGAMWQVMGMMSRLQYLPCFSWDSVSKPGLYAHICAAFAQ
jgi:hypothetical protein